ncbi:hypothetical protein K437DRAFT_259520 [Tilletiaria anomala UBC 951]|uniref:Uncharacterized protein n=1 Tax=Tilletiaria anomala (strain ATCC 24038 / CBS 436.72 / UBC 951) TaxID=1037660 RepID=A0A066VHT6_TILAU|nr:uncharacterized protein K437DRAFT_259520 [Tilletiaria anomala UBC 951]KDN38155.1 hypothetical protein K437DRAFT_259520 [Tilletiaria anomala UBC 951]
MIDPSPIPVDSPGGFIFSFPFTPMYAYATLKGKFAVLDDVLPKLPEQVFDGPTLHAGCDGGMVLIKTAQIKRNGSKSARRWRLPMALTSSPPSTRRATTRLPRPATCLQRDSQTLSSSIPPASSTCPLPTTSSRSSRAPWDVSVRSEGEDVCSLVAPTAR